MFIIRIMNKGASFCHVIKIKQFLHFIPWIIAGNQKCKGAAPIFNKIIDVSISLIIGIGKIKWDFAIISRIVVNRKIDANAWIKKYFRVASFPCWLCLSIISGIKAIKLSSSPTHTEIQVEEEIEMMVPETNMTKKTVLINIWRKYSIGGVWTQ